MTIEEKLQGRIISNPIKGFRKELEQVYLGNILTRMFSKNKLKKEVELLLKQLDR